MVAISILAQIGISSDAGRLLSAMRDNEMRCAYLGLNTPRIRIALLVVCAIVAALAGFGYAGFGGIAAPENASFTFGTQLVIMVALGGRGTLVGALLGALLLELASASVSGSLPFVWELIVGVAFILVIVVLPAGLFGSARNMADKLFRKAARKAVTLQTSPSSLTRSPDEVAVEVSGVGKNFGGLSVLSNVSFSARRGELVSLVESEWRRQERSFAALPMAANGRPARSGQLGESIGRLPPHRIVALGLGRKFRRLPLL